MNSVWVSNFELSMWYTNDQFYKNNHALPCSWVCTLRKSSRFSDAPRFPCRGGFRMSKKAILKGALICLRPPEKVCPLAKKANCKGTFECLKRLPEMVHPSAWKGYLKRCMRVPEKATWKGIFECLKRLPEKVHLSAWKGYLKRYIREPEKATWKGTFECLKRLPEKVHSSAWKGYLKRWATNAALEGWSVYSSGWKPP